jgi:hypothetical protein
MQIKKKQDNCNKKRKIKKKKNKHSIKKKFINL